MTQILFMGEKTWHFEDIVLSGRLSRCKSLNLDLPLESDVHWAHFAIDHPKVPEILIPKVQYVESLITDSQELKPFEDFSFHLQSTFSLNIAQVSLKAVETVCTHF